MEPIRPLVPAPPPVLQPPAAAGPDPSQFRAFGDTARTRQFIYDDVAAAASALAPFSADGRTLRLSNVRYLDPERFSRKDRKRAILTGGTVGRRLKGTWELVDDATGGVLDRRDQVIAKVPYFDSMGTMTHRGNAYTINHQQRLRPGIYTRLKENGELEAHANVLPGKGVAHRYMLDPAKETFRLKIHQAELPLYPILKAMGAHDRDLQEAWGPQIYAANAKLADAGAVRKLKDKVLGWADRQDPDESGWGRKLAAAFDRMEIEPEISRRTLGRDYDRISPDAILAATRKLLAVSRGEAEADDRDHPAYQRFVGPEDLIRERIERDHGRLQKKAFRQAVRDGDLRRMPSGLLTPQIEQVLTGSGLAQCFDAATLVLTRRGWIAWPEVRDDDEFACLLSDKIEYHKARRVFRHRYVGELVGCRTKTFSYLVTPNHRCWTRSRDNQYHEETADAIYGKPRYHRTAFGPLARPTDPDEYVLPQVRENRHGNWLPAVVVDMDAWLEFLGWWLAEGSACEESGQNEYRVTVAQSREANPDNVRRIARVLRRLPFSFRYSDGGNEFVIRSKVLWTELRRYGVKHEKRIPRYVFELSETRLQRLCDAYMLGDGNTHNGRKKTETVSPGLALDLVELFGRLGRVGRASHRRLSEKNPNWKDSYIVSYGLSREAYIASASEAARTGKPDPHYTKDYDGFVYCAEVPGHLLYVMRNGKPHWSHNSIEEINPLEVFDKQSRITRMGEGGLPSLDSVPESARAVQPAHYGFLDPSRTPESFRAGIDLNLASGARKGRDGTIYAQFVNPRTGKLEWKSPRDLADAKVAFPNWASWKTKRVPVLAGGIIDYADKNELQSALPHMDAAFSPLANLVPMLGSVKGQRVAMASRMITQALPLAAPEAPLVQGALPGSNRQRSYEDEYGAHAGAVRADKGGRVEAFKDGALHVRYDDGSRDQIELYDNFPFARKTFYHQTPMIEPGQSFKPGQLLAKSNYTDDRGAVAVGTNARVAYVPWKGLNYEDAIVISESMARKLTSTHMYQHDLEVGDKHKVGKRDYLGMFPAKYNREALGRIGDDGVIRPGETVHYGDPLVLSIKERDRPQTKLHKARQAGYDDASVVWKHHDPGVVTDVAWGKTGPAVVVKSQSQMQVGDKLSGRYGDKGVIAAIIHDDAMPHDRDGRPFEILANNLGITSRTNPSQLLEAWLGKIAAQTGAPYKVENFLDVPDMTQHVVDELTRHGLQPREDLIDPETGKAIPGIITGNRFFMKLAHTAESKAQSRGSGGYSMDETPSKGGESGCFVGDTLIRMTGPFGGVGAVPIAAVVESRYSGMASSRDLDFGADLDRPVVDWFACRVPPSELVEIELANGEVVVATRGHVFYRADGAKAAAGELQPGDDLME